MNFIDVAKILILHYKKLKKNYSCIIYEKAGS